MTEQEAMRRALTLARKGWGRVSPNPLVGAVILRAGDVIGEGYHGEYGGEHAEVAALAACADPRGATCVVTLEPCLHHGHTPPCTDALLSSGVIRVVYAVADPNTKACGGGRALQAGGVDVECGLEAAAAAALNAPFLWSTTRPERPFVALKLAATLDGYSADSTGKSQWISSPEAREYVHWLRAGFDAIAVGRRTAETDNPRLTARGDLVPRIPPKRVVVGRTGSLGRHLELVRTAGEIPTIFLTENSVVAEAEFNLRDTKVEVVGFDTLNSALAQLRARGVQSLLVEGGARLAGGLLDAGLVDRIYWIQAPLLFGSGEPAFAQRDSTSLAESVRWVPTERESLGDSNLLVVDRELCLRES